MDWFTLLIGFLFWPLSGLLYIASHNFVILLYNLYRYHYNTELYIQNGPIDYYIEWYQCIAGGIPLVILSIIEATKQIRDI